MTTLQRTTLKFQCLLKKKSWTLLLAIIAAPVAMSYFFSITMTSDDVILSLPSMTRDYVIVSLPSMTRDYVLVNSPSFTNSEKIAIGAAIAKASTHTMEIIVQLLERDNLGWRGNIIATYLSMDIATSEYADTSTVTACRREKWGSNYVLVKFCD